MTKFYGKGGYTRNIHPEQPEVRFIQAQRDHRESRLVFSACCKLGPIDMAYTVQEWPPDQAAIEAGLFDRELPPGYIPMVAP